MKKFIMCFVIHSLQAGGMERVMVELINYFSKKNNLQIHVVLYGITREIFFPLPRDITLHCPEFEFNPNYRLISTFKTLFFLRKKVKNISPDVILSFGEYWNNFVLLATLGLKLSIYVSDRSQPDKSLGVIQNSLRKWLYPKASGVIAQTEVAKRIYEKYYRPKRIIVIGNPIRKILTKSKSKSPKRKNQVLMVGRLIKSKHQDELIRIFASVNNPEWRLIIIGDDHLKQQNRVVLEELIRNLNMEDRIKLVGKRLDVEEFYLNSKIFAFTSSSEGFPNVIGEAMSAGLPVIAYDCIAGPSEMIMDGINGYLIPLHNKDIFASRLKELMENQEKIQKMGSAAEKSIQEFSSHIIGEKFYEFMFRTSK